MPYFDTHSHLTLSTHISPKQHVERANKAGVSHILDPGLRLSDIQERMIALSGLAGVMMGVAIAPHDSQRYLGNRALMQDELAKLEQWLPPFKNDHLEKRFSTKATKLELGVDSGAWPEIVALSEIGLEYHHFKPPYDVQLELFEAQLKLAISCDLPVFLHLRNGGKKGDAGFRDAYGDAAELVSKYPKLKGAVHCFSAGEVEADRFLKMGFYLSFSGVVTYRSAREVSAVAAEMDVRRILLETDAPYLSPQPVRGEKNESANLVHIAKHIAFERARTAGADQQSKAAVFATLEQQLAKRCFHNAQRLLDRD